jgi:(p)ppGpp synthase/HD superfamily hydrolase
LEALQCFAPLGHALGMGSVSAELEDCCFRVRN